MYTFTTDYREGFKSGITNREFIRAGYFTVHGETISNSIITPSSQLFHDCVYLAYLDAKRKFAGIGSISTVDKERCFTWLADELKQYFRNPVKANESEYDSWHETICNALIAKFCSVGYTKTTVGMAQKVINLSFKYLHCCNWGTIGADYFEYCHMALDDYTLRWYTRVINPANAIMEWSPITSYADYIEIQRNTRSFLSRTFVGSNRESLLINEFYIWPDEFIVESLIQLRKSIDKYFNCTHRNSEITDLYSSPVDPRDPSSTINDFISHF